ncbi:MAG: hypothetical protein AAF211_24810 [Myxococcota bacterium]
MKAGKDVKVKKSCCKKRKRCKTCPALWKRLQLEGFAERVAKRRYRTVRAVKKGDRRIADS